jgi:hypothetical protein
LPTFLDMDPWPPAFRIPLLIKFYVWDFCIGLCIEVLVALCIVAFTGVCSGMSPMSTTISFMAFVKVYEFSRGIVAYGLEPFVMNAQLSLVFVTSSQLMKTCYFTSSSTKINWFINNEPNNVVCILHQITNMQRLEYWPLSHELQDHVVVAIAKELWEMMCNLVLWAHCPIIFILLCS